MAEQPETWVDRSARTIGGICFAFLLLLLVIGATWRDYPSLSVAIALLSAVGGAGLLLALILFMDLDEDMKSLKAIIVGALSGTGLLKAQDFASIVRRHFGELDQAGKQWSAVLFFLAVAGFILGFVGGFLLIRLRLQRVVAEAASEVSRLVAGVGQLTALPWPELREDFPTTTGELPDEKTINQLVAIKDWGNTLQTTPFGQLRLFS